MEMIIHSDIKERVLQDFSHTVKFGEDFLNWIQSPVIAKDDSPGASLKDKPCCQPVEECLAEVKERKIEWEEMWEDRFRKLQKLADGEAPEHSSSEVSEENRIRACNIKMSDMQNENTFLAILLKKLSFLWYIVCVVLQQH